MKAVLLYNLYPINHWRELTTQLLKNVPHQEIYIHVSLPLVDLLLPYRKKRILDLLTEFTSFDHIFFSRNKRVLGETLGFEVFRKNIDFSSHSMLTYMHSKGVSRRKYKSKNVKDWVEMMRYFMIDRFDLCAKAFHQGYHLCGCNLYLRSELPQQGAPEPLLYVPYHYSGNFVSVNMDALRKKFLTTPCDPSYFGVEAFWGKLTPLEKAFCVHQSGIKNHYAHPYPENLYKTSLPSESASRSHPGKTRTILQSLKNNA